MARSKKKLNYVHRSSFKKNMLNTKKVELREKIHRLMISTKVRLEPSCLFWKRNSLINENLINKKIGVYNGWGFHHTDITKDFLGLKLCGLNTTRRTPVHKGKQRQNKKVVKKSNIDKTILYKKKKGWA